ncbi:MAG: acylphosphatase [Planctomycetes bacterium]|nr:acylphosphatase [Planctomycetota bacterium]
MARECRNLHYSGQVQGVGFRWTACRIAGGYAVTGYVRNLPDGSVELMAEGEAAELDAFLGELRSAMGRHIRKETGQTCPVTNAFQAFGVRY